MGGTKQLKQARKVINYRLVILGDLMMDIEQVLIEENAEVVLEVQIGEIEVQADMTEVDTHDIVQKEKEGDTEVLEDMIEVTAMTDILAGREMIIGTGTEMMTVTEEINQGVTGIMTAVGRTLTVLGVAADTTIIHIESTEIENLQNRPSIIEENDQERHLQSPQMLHLHQKQATPLQNK